MAAGPIFYLLAAFTAVLGLQTSAVNGKVAVMEIFVLIGAVRKLIGALAKKPHKI